MRPEAVSLLRCPRTGGHLRVTDRVVAEGRIVSGALVSESGQSYPIRNGIPDFTDSTALTDHERQTRTEYERVAEGIYDTAVDWQFAAFQEDEHTVREAMVDLLCLTPSARVLEVGSGTGRDSVRLARRLGAEGLLHLQDLSPAMAAVCARRMAREGVSCTLDYSVSSALELPFPDEAFDAVFHFGGFNQFGDLRRGAAELTRVVRRGGRVLIGDEAVAPWLKGSEFDHVVTTNNPLFSADTPLDVLPACARDVTCRWIIGNCFYVIVFDRGDGPPPLDLDLPHQGWRGGTMRSRYYGRLEGVTVDAKALAHEAAAREGLSVHAWLDRVVRDAATAGDRSKP
ncbi:MAG: methyltransferase domain-containing protein [Acidimicrobiia bacterium]|nr:methyltransferase domain-containing protein [Acidimicrobiia bacterium]